MFPDHFFSKGNHFCDFLLAALDDEVFTKWSFSVKERIPHRGNFPLSKTREIWMSEICIISH